MEKDEKYYVVDGDFKVKFCQESKLAVTQYMANHPDMTMVIATSEHEAILLAKEMAKYEDES
jgi:hypothetical protein